MSQKIARREFLASTGALSAAVATGGFRLLLPKAAFAHELPVEENCQLITSVTEPQTHTTSFFVVDNHEGTISPDSVVFSAQSGALSFLDGTGLTYRTLTNELRFDAGFLILNRHAFDLADPKEASRGAKTVVSRMVDDPDLLTVTTLMGAGALLGYNSVVMQSDLQPFGGLSREDLFLAAEIAQESLNLLHHVPAAEQLRTADFREALLKWQADVGEFTRPIQKAILDANTACVNGAANDLALKKCQAIHEARQKCLDNARNYASGMCKSFAEAPEGRRDRIAGRVKLLFDACKP